MLGNSLPFPVLVLVKSQGWSDCGEAVSSLGGKEGAPVSECFRCRGVAGGAKRALGRVEGCLALLEEKSHLLKCQVGTKQGVAPQI